MISLNEERFDQHAYRSSNSTESANNYTDQAAQIGEEVLARVKKLAVEKPLVVVAAGLAIGVLSGFMLKRN